MEELSRYLTSTSSLRNHSHMHMYPHLYSHIHHTRGHIHVSGGKIRLHKTAWHLQFYFDGWYLYNMPYLHCRLCCCHLLLPLLLFEIKPGLALYTETDPQAFAVLDCLLFLDRNTFCGLSFLLVFFKRISIFIREFTHPKLHLFWNTAHLHCYHKWELA